MVVRKFEIELDVPDDFDEAYTMPYVLGTQCVVRNGIFMWCVYADPKKLDPQWIKADSADEGKSARFRDDESEEWVTGKLLHYDAGTKQPWLGLVRNDVDVVIEPRWFNFCEVQL